jgi:hypothetical protein
MTAVTGLAAYPWRTGRSLGRTVYARTGGDDWEADTVIGMLDTPQLAEAACQAHNDALALRQAARRRADGAHPGEGRPPAVALLEEALFLRQNGERAPGGNETWHDWDLRAERLLRSLLPEPDAGAPR